RHEKRLGAAVGLEAEQRPAVVDEVELDIATAPAQLPHSLELTVGLGLPALCDRYVRLDKRAPEVAHEVEHLLGRVLALATQAIEEHTADTTGLCAMWQEEVVIAPGLEAIVVADRAMPIAGIGEHLVEVHRVVFEQV